MDEFAQGPEIQSQDHYPYVTRSLVRLYDKGLLTNVVGIDIEPKYGYVSRIAYADGNYRITYGNDLGVNAGAASDLATDKGHTKFLLRRLDIHCPAGDEFLLPWWETKIGESQSARGNKSIKSTNSARDYAEQQLGYPLYAKPVDGSQGADIFLVEDGNELSGVIEYYEQSRVRVMMLEEPIDMPDYRVVTLDGELISAYRRIPLAVVGDGENTIDKLLSALQSRYEEEGRDTRINRMDPRLVGHLGKQGLRLDSIPAFEETVVLVPVSNLSIGGTSEDVSDAINERWVELAAFVAKNFNLRLCGLDLACQDIADPDSDYSVLELNAAPGLDHYALSGEAQQQIVDRLYALYSMCQHPTSRLCMLQWYHVAQ